ncbi:MAG: glutaredoxin family protein [Chloroflexi bacterium]|nr:MAG: glutaredoxin family protein [Chloroflexota bacterium]
MASEKELVVYVRRMYCPNVALARDVLKRYGIPYREVNVDTSPELAERLKAWTGGFLSVPTLVVANPGEDIPYTEILPIPADRPLRGYDRGPMITEPNNQELENWLYKHGFLDKPYQR